MIIVINLPGNGHNQTENLECSKITNVWENGEFYFIPDAEYSKTTKKYFGRLIPLHDIVEILES